MSSIRRRSRAGAAHADIDIMAIVGGIEQQEHPIGSQPLRSVDGGSISMAEARPAVLIGNVGRREGYVTVADAGDDPGRIVSFCAKDRGNDPVVPLMTPRPSWRIRNRIPSPTAKSSRCAYPDEVTASIQKSGPRSAPASRKRLRISVLMARSWALVQARSRQS